LIFKFLKTFFTNIAKNIDIIVFTNLMSEKIRQVKIRLSFQEIFLSNR